MARRHSRILLTTSVITRAGVQAFTATAKVLALAAVFAVMSGCSGLFFYPDNVTYITPDRLNLNYEDIYLETADGETLNGWWLPADPGQGPAKGTIYYLHGNAQNISSHILNIAWLPAEGYNVFTLDYRGFGKSTGAPDIEGALLDAETGMRWLAQQPDVQSGPIFLLGQSLGGAIGLTLASEWEKRGKQPPFSAVVLDSTFAGFRSIAQDKLGDFWLTWPFQIPLSWTITDDYEGVDRIADISPVPVMIIHSVRDSIIPFHNGTELYDAAKEPKEFLRTDTPHAATFIIPAYKESVLKFLEAN
jgi:fermentation-respiration switch protein FrsA (DUF1100 family)